MNRLTESQIATIKDAGRKLTGVKRRAFQAQVAVDYVQGNSRRAESVFGWSRQTVELGLNERRTGIICLGRFSDRGNRKTEEKVPQLEQDIRFLAEPESQTDPKFQSPFQYTRMTAKGMRQALLDQKDWRDEELPCENTIGVIMNRLGYRLRRVQKARPLKRICETDAIFENVRRENEASDGRADSLRISIDAKAKVDLGDFSRRGKSRGKKGHSGIGPRHGEETKAGPFRHLGRRGGIADNLRGNITGHK